MEDQQIEKYLEQLDPENDEFALFEQSVVL